MIIYAVYIVKSDGSILLSEHFQSEEDLPNNVFLGGLIAALKGFTQEVLGNEMKSIEVEGLIYHIRSFGFYNIVLITDLRNEPENLIQELGLRFMKKHGEDILETDDEIRLDKFHPFKDTIREIIGIESYDQTKSIKPSKMLNAKEIFELPIELQPVALTMISLGEGPLNQIAEDCELKAEDLEPRLKQLQNLGFIGEKKKNDVTYFFCITY